MGQEMAIRRRGRKLNGIKAVGAPKKKPPFASLEQAIPIVSYPERLEVFQIVRGEILHDGRVGRRDGRGVVSAGRHLAAGVARVESDRASEAPLIRGGSE